MVGEILRFNRLAPRALALGTLQGCPLGQWLDDLDHARRVIGIDHVGIGTDMTGLSTFTALPTYRGFPALPAALLARGYAEADVRRVLGGNLLRVLEAVSA